MDDKTKDRLRNNLIFWMHVVFIVSWLTSPFWLYWPLLVVLSVILYLQSMVLGYCVVTKWQFGDGDRSFWVHYLGKAGVKVTKAQVTFYTRIFLVASPILGWLWQAHWW